MGLLDFDVGKIANNDAFMLGMGILGNNAGHYGELGPALGGGLKDYQRQKSLQGQQARANQQAEYQKQLQLRQRQQWEQQKAQYEQAEIQKQANEKYYASQGMGGMPQNVRDAKIKAKYNPGSGIVGSPLKLGSGNYGYMGPGGKVKDTNTPFFNPYKNVMVNNVPYNYNPRTGQMGMPTQGQGQPPITHKTIAGQKADEQRQISQAKADVKSQAAKDEEARLAEGALGYINESRSLVKDMSEAQLGPLANKMPNLSYESQLLNQQLTNLIGNVRTKLGPGLLSDTDIKLLKGMIPHMGMDKDVLLKSLDMFEAELNRIISGKTGSQSNGWSIEEVN